MEIYNSYNTFNPVELNELNYPYMGQPPSGYGPVTRYTLESVARSTEYANGEQRCEMDSFPERGTTGKFSPKAAQVFANAFVQRFSKEITDSVGKGINWYKTQPYTVLKKGRMTWSWIKRKNEPASVALLETIDVLKTNTRKTIPDSIMSYVNAVEELLEMKEIHSDDGFCKTDFKIANSKRVKFSVSDGTVMSQRELRKRFFEINTMIKHKERGKLKRRMIATPSMLARGHIAVLEALSGFICSSLPNTGIPIGGNEKKGRLYNLLHHSDLRVGTKTMEVTGDNTKWNECLSPDCMWIILNTFLTHANAPKDYKDLIRNTLQFFKRKRVVYGQGIKFVNAFGDSIWRDVPEMKRNMTDIKNSDNELWTILDTIESLECDSESIVLPTGMLMGMLNMTSTVVALVGLEYGVTQVSNKNCHIKPMESSDDFIIVGCGPTIGKLLDYIEKARLRCRLVGVNWSLAKTWIASPAGLGEFTSYYHDGPFVGNVGVELPGITAQGINPLTDLTTGTQFIRTAMANGSLLPGGAYTALAVLARSYKFAYNAPEDGSIKGPRHSYLSNKELDKTGLMYFGGDCCITPSTTHINEIILRHREGTLTRDVLKRLISPRNPFSPSAELVTRIDMEAKRSYLVEEEGINSILGFTMTRNRTILNSTISKETIEKEKVFQKLTRVCNTIFPELDIKPRQSNILISKALIDDFELSIRETIPPEDMEEANQMLKELKGVVPRESQQELEDTSDSDDDC